MKKTVAIILCVVMALSMAACGSSKEEDSNAEKDTTESVSYEGVDELNATISEDVEETVAALYTEYDELLEIASDYDAFTSSITDVESFYSVVLEETKELCIRMREYSVTYAETILSSGDSADDMRDGLDGLYDDIYNGALDDIYDNIYNGLLDEVYDAFYNGILDEAYDSVDYSEWSSASSEEYSRWSSCSSDVYSTWSSCSSDVYGFWSNLSSALYNDDVDKAYEEIDNFEEDIENIKNGIDPDEENSEESTDEANTSEEETKTTIEDNTATSEVESEITSETETSGGTTSDTSEDLVDGMRPSFKEAMDSYEAFYDEYCEFMKEYMENPSDLSLLAEYTELVAKEVEMNEKFEAWDEDEMNDAELKYYLEVNSRVTQKLLEVAQ